MKYRLLILLCIFFYSVTAYSNDGIPIEMKAKKLEAVYQGSLGFSAINTANGSVINYNSEKLFPMCSTSKLMVVAAVLKYSMSHSNFLNTKILITNEIINTSGYAPVTKQYILKKMTIAQLCMAAITRSDNAAVNILIKSIGGPKAVTNYAHSIGNMEFRLDRWEPELNSAIPGDKRDTTTPKAMTDSIQKLLFGDILAPTQRKLLKTWLENNTTGNFRIRAGVPDHWIVGDKTGTGYYGTTNDIGIIWPNKCPSIIISVYFTQFEKNSKPEEKIIQDVTKMVIDSFAKKDKCLLTAMSY